MDYIKEKVNKLNSDLEQLEEQMYELAIAQKAEHIAKGKLEHFFLAKWIHQLRAPKVALPDCHKVSRGYYFHRAFATGDLKELASELNLYVLNAAIKLARLKAGSHLMKQVEELRKIAEEIRNKAEYERLN